MNAQLPAWLQNRKSAAIGSRAVEGLGAALPPHISIAGNRFTLVDAAGNDKMLDTVFMDACIVDVSDVTCKMYFENEWSTNSKDPPTCWSANGVAPSIEAITPQSATCDTCPQNVRGSAESKLNPGMAIKACRDEKWMAVLVPGFNLLFRFQLTPGSFKNFKAYDEKFKGQKQVDISDVLTRFAFETGKNGVLTFAAASYIDEATANLREQALLTKATDVLVGRTDRPRMAALAAPAAAQGTGQQPLLAQQPGTGQPPPNLGYGVTQEQPAGAAPFVPSPAPTAAGPGPTIQSNAPIAAAASPSEPAKRGRRPRATAQTAAPTQQEVQAPFATNQPAAAGAPFGGVAQTAAPATVATAQPASGGAASGAPFGVQTAVAPNPEVSTLLNTIFGPTT